MKGPIPVGNKKLFKIWREKDLELHQKKLKSMKGVVDATAP